MEPLVAEEGLYHIISNHVKIMFLILFVKIEEMNVTPWTVSSKSGIDYNKLIHKFGSTQIDAALIAR